VSWNVNGLVGVSLSDAIAELGSPDVVCLQEVRAAPPSVDGYRIAHALAERGRRYGVATLIRDALAATHETAPWDREGRVLVSEVAGVSVINVYMVNGTPRPHLDPATGAALGTRSDFKRVVQRLVGELLELRRDRAIAIGDWNVTPTALDTHPRLRTEEPHATARAELAAIRDALDLVDAFRALHPTERAYTWYQRGRRLDAARVDYALVSRALMPRVARAEVLARRPDSDHAPIVVELDSPAAR